MRNSLKTALAAGLLISGFLLHAFSAKAQTGSPEGNGNTFRRGSITLSIAGGYGVDYHYTRDRPPMTAFKAVLEFGVWKAGPGTVSLGLENGLMVATGQSTGAVLALAGRSAWHYGWHVRGLDTYAGLSAGGHVLYNTDKVYQPGESEYEDDIHPCVGVFAGASYFVTRHFGFNIEAGYDITVVQFGLIFKFR